MTNRKPTRQEIWAHNGLLSGVAMASANMWKIQGASTAAVESKILAAKLQSDLSRLEKLIRTRKDQE